MITIYKKGETCLETLSQATSGCWLNVVDPTAAEIAQLQQMLSVPQDWITYPLDLDERARIEKENGFTMIVLRVPRFQGESSDIPYTTVPLGMVATDGYIVTVCKIESDVTQELLRARALSTAKRNRFILRLLFIMANRYLTHLRTINKAVDQLEDQLQLSLRNSELLELLKYEKSLVYFTTALKSNELILRHLEKGQLFQQYPEDMDLLEDVVTEVRQAIEMTDISSSILRQMVDTFASIISNNLNAVMKFMAAVTIILSFPTIIASLYGMNVGLPLQNSPWAFLMVVLVALFACATVLVVFWKKDWL
ncbi:MAG: magnesium transporter CorA family protein [Thermoflexales bacterium]|nr:magnesium transporter CorA family protein [Thermoflexales bacterium]